MSGWVWYEIDKAKLASIEAMDAAAVRGDPNSRWLAGQLRAALAELQRRDSMPELREAFVHAIRFGLEAGSRDAYLHGRRYQRRAQRAEDDWLYGKLSELLEKYRNPLEILRGATPPTPAPVAAEGPVCPSCNGSGITSPAHELDAEDCDDCNGTGRRRPAPTPAAGPGDSEGARCIHGFKVCSWCSGAGARREAGRE